MISIIIPAFKSVKFIDECIKSVNIPGVEILIGVDCCIETYNHIKHLDGVFYFPKNVGPYVIKNTLVDIASNQDIIFFDADDIMVTESIIDIKDALQNSDYVRLNYLNFRETSEKDDWHTDVKVNNDAVIAIKKDLFNSLNGFYPWRCGADSEFKYRLEHNNLKEGKIHDLCYYRRIHGENLTMKEETCHGSAIRNEYLKIINTNRRAENWPNPEIKTKEEYYAKN
jgi:glycosyltransferase involved in cell wall biosynthesis